MTALVVHDSEAEVGFAGTGRAKDAFAKLWPVVPAPQAMLANYATPACTVGYLTPKPRPDDSSADYVTEYEDQQYRYNLPALALCRQLDIEPLMCWVFVDVDNRGLPEGGHEKWESPQAGVTSVRGIIERARKHEILESVGWYLSESGFRLVWRLETPIPVGFYKSWATEFLTTLSKVTGLDFANIKTKSGGIDLASREWTREYRLPRVTKAGRTDVLRLPMDLSRMWKTLLTWKPQKALTREAVPLLSEGDWVSDDLPCGGTLPKAADVDKEIWGRLERAKCYGAAWRAEPLAEKGKRDPAMVSAVGEVLACLDGHVENLAETAYKVLARAVAVWGDEEGAPTLSKLWKKCKEFAQRRHTNKKRTEEFQLNNAYLVYLASDGTTFYVWNDIKKGYEPPIKGHGALLNRMAHPSLGLEKLPGMSVLDDKGKFKEMNRLIYDYGHVAHRVVAVCGAEKTTYDKEKYILYEAVASRIEIPAVYHEDVIEWLTLLGGEFSEQFLDWIATIRELDRPTCAVYLESTPGSGKGMLASGLARLWQASSPCSYREATGTFNQALMRCPLVFLDEGIGDDRSWSTQFRAFIGSSEHELRIKHRETMVLLGCPRMLIVANGGDALKLREKFEENDRQAITDRIFHSKTGGEAREFLINYGGRAATSDWVKGSDGEPGKIAQTVAWLEANRTVQPGSRFIVDPPESDWHLNFLTQGKVGDVLTVIALILMANAKDGRVVRKDGLIYIQRETIRDNWIGLMKEAPPTMSQIGGALKALAPQSKNVRTGPANADVAKMWGIDPQKILHNAKYGHIDDGTLKARLDGTYVAPPRAQTSTSNKVPAEAK